MMALSQLTDQTDPMYYCITTTMPNLECLVLNFPILATRDQQTTIFGSNLLTDKMDAMHQNYRVTTTMQNLESLVLKVPIWATRGQRSTFFGFIELYFSSQTRWTPYIKITESQPQCQIMEVLFQKFQFWMIQT